MKIDSAVLGILAIIAGVIILFGWVQLYLVVGIFLIIWGALTLARR